MKRSLALLSAAILAVTMAAPVFASSVVNEDTSILATTTFNLDVSALHYTDITSISGWVLPSVPVNASINSNNPTGWTYSVAAADFARTGGGGTMLAAIRAFSTKNGITGIYSVVGAQTPNSNAGTPWGLPANTMIVQQGTQNGSGGNYGVSGSTKNLVTSTAADASTQTIPEYMTIKIPSAQVPGTYTSSMTFTLATNP